MRTATWSLDAPMDLQRTFAPLVRGLGDRTIRLSAGRALWPSRTVEGPATLALSVDGRHLRAEAWGPGAERVLDAVPDLLGLQDAGRRVGALADVPDRRVARMATHSAAVRILRTGAVVDALVPAILEQEVTGFEAHRAWHGLVRTYGEDAPGPAAGAVGLRHPPGPATLASLPYYDLHRFGVEQKRADLIRGVAARSGSFEAIVDLSPAAAQDRLTRVPGIGPWTAAEVAVRALGDVDAVSVGDFHLKHLVAYALAGEPRGTDERMLELLEPFRGRRALVIRALELSGLRAPRYGPRLAPRAIAGI
jgi:3-methyladenine DNA glycosylase/8-oxoguanine DNA glycosylase